MGNINTQYDYVFVDDSAKNGVGLPGVFCHTPTHPKVDGKYLTFAETVTAGKPDGLVNNEEAMEKLRQIVVDSEKSKIVIWLDVDKCFDGVVSLSRKKEYTLDEMLQAYISQGVDKGSEIFQTQRTKMIDFLSFLLENDVKVVFWTANNRVNTISRFRNFWEIPNEILNACGIVCGRRGNRDIPKKDLVKTGIITLGEEEANKQKKRKGLEKKKVTFKKQKEA
jgi:hypothetical protein